MEGVEKARHNPAQERMLMLGHATGDEDVSLCRPHHQPNIVKIYLMVTTTTFESQNENKAPLRQHAAARDNGVVFLRTNTVT